MARNTKTVRVLFSVEVIVPLDNPNTMTQGPGPVLMGFVGDMMSERLSNAPGWLGDEVPWGNSMGPFELEAVEEYDPLTDQWRRVGWRQRV